MSHPWGPFHIMCIIIYVLVLYFIINMDTSNEVILGQGPLKWPVIFSNYRVYF